MALFNFVASKGRNTAFPLLFSPFEVQQRQLAALLKKAQNTEFGLHYNFGELLRQYDLVEAFRERIPVHDYNQMYDNWWSKAYLCDTPNVSWPGVIPYYALSSGTSQAASKNIPVSYEMLRSMKKGSRRVLLDLARMPELPVRQFAKKMLMIGSCTAIKQEGRHFVGDLSGITGHTRPFWIERNYAPGRHITDLPSWNDRIEAIVQEAPTWDVGFVAGSVAWIQLIFERIIAENKVSSVHDVWPHLEVFVHGGVFFEPYRASFEKLLNRPILTLDSYMASEGFIAYQNRPDNRSMKILHDCGIFFEFIPFDEPNFDEDGNLKKSYPETRNISNVAEGTEYAIVLTTNAGAWRYLLGDTIRFTDTERGEIRITGRTKQFLSFTGEHVSVDNLNEAVRRVDAQVHVGVREFAVAGVPEGTHWSHHWYVGMDNPKISAGQFAQLVDAALCDLNDDYKIERSHALKGVHATILPNQLFFKWLEQKGKANGQAKIPRVLKGTHLKDFQTFLSREGYPPK